MLCTVDTKNERQICDLLRMTQMWKIVMRELRVWGGKSSEQVINTCYLMRQKEKQKLKKISPGVDDDDNEWVRKVERKLFFAQVRRKIIS